MYTSIRSALLDYILDSNNRVIALSDEVNVTFVVQTLNEHHIQWKKALDEWIDLRYSPLKEPLGTGSYMELPYNYQMQDDWPELVNEIPSRHIDAPRRMPAGSTYHMNGTGTTQREAWRER